CLLMPSNNIVMCPQQKTPRRGVEASSGVTTGRKDRRPESHGKAESLRLARPLHLGEQVALGGPRSCAPPTRPAEHVRHSYRHESAGQWADDINPVVRESAARQIRPEGARGIHRGTRDRATPQACEDDVSTDAERAEDADVLRAGGGPEDDADEAQ